MKGNVSHLSILIRQATEDDLPASYEIQQEASAAEGLAIGNVGAAPPGRIPSKFRHELEHGRFLVAEVDGGIAGFGAAFVRDDVVFLATLFVRPEAQLAGLGVGQKLLDELFAGPALLRCVVSSHVHRALALYARSGILPRWPLYMLDGKSDRLSLSRSRCVEAIAANPEDPELLAIDARIAGRGIRSKDQAYWLETQQAVPHWVFREGRRAGYGYIQYLGRGDDAPWKPDTALIGPVGLWDSADVADAVLALVEIAQPVASTLVADVPGSNPALPALLAAGFRIHYQATFCSSAGNGPFDPSCYVPADTITF